MLDRFEVQARCVFRGRDLHMNKIVTDFDLDEIRPSRSLPGLFDYALEMRTAERRQRLVDMIAAEFAHSLTEALFKL